MVNRKIIPVKHLPLKLGQNISYNHPTLNGLVHMLVAFKKGKHVPTIFHGQPPDQLLYHLQREERDHITPQKIWLHKEPLRQMQTGWTKRERERFPPLPLVEAI